jgi:hypothetical protein
MYHGRERQPRIGGPACDDDLCALAEGFDNRKGTEIHIGGNNPLPHRIDRLVRFHVAEFDALRKQLVDTIEYVVTVDHTDAQAADAQARGFTENGITAGKGIDTATVGDDSDIAVDDLGKDAPDLSWKIPCIAEFGIAQFLFLHDGHGDFSEEVHHEVIDGTACHLVIRSIDEITPESLAAGDANGLVQYILPASVRLRGNHGWFLRAQYER